MSQNQRKKILQRKERKERKNKVARRLMMIIFSLQMISCLIFLIMEIQYKILIQAILTLKNMGTNINQIQMKIQSTQLDLRMLMAMIFAIQIQI